MQNSVKKKSKSDIDLIIKHRYCRKCKKLLTPNRYFNCNDCIKELESDDVIYNGGKFN